MSTIIRKRPGIVPAADTKLPKWNTVLPTDIQGNKILIGDDLKGADVAFNNSAPVLNATGSPKLWTGASWTRKVDGAARTANNGLAIARIDCGIANHRVRVKIEHTGLNGDLPGLVFRYVDDNNYWRVFTENQNNIARLTKVVAGAGTNLSSALPLVDGAVYEVRCNGNDISVWINGVQAFAATDAALNTATKVGFANTLLASPSRFSNFEAGAL